MATETCDYDPEEANHGPLPWRWDNDSESFVDANGEQVVYGLIRQDDAVVGCEPHDGVYLLRSVNSHDELVAAAKVLCDDAHQQGGFGDEDSACCENSHMMTIGHHMPDCPRIAAWARLRSILNKLDQ